MSTPVTFSAFDSRLTIATLVDKPKTLNIFYRDESRHGPLEALSGPDVGELVARLGGASEEGFHFNYGDIVAILGSMVEKQKVPAAFVLQQLPGVETEIKEAPMLPDQGRPQADATAKPPVEASLPDLRPATSNVPVPSDKKDGTGRPQ